MENIISASSFVVYEMKRFSLGKTKLLDGRFHTTCNVLKETGLIKPDLYFNVGEKLVHKEKIKDYNGLFFDYRITLRDAINWPLVESNLIDRSFFIYDVFSRMRDWKRERQEQMI